MKLYRYVGPRHIAERISPERTGVPVTSPGAVRAWVRESAQDLSSGQVTATFVVDHTGALLIADRRSEHVACAGGRPVRAAGEITFRLATSVEVLEVSNQSTGFCPEPESWLAVAAALSGAGLVAPPGYTLACEFRRCAACGNITLIKHRVFECGMCRSELPVNYNVQ